MTRKPITSPALCVDDEFASLVSSQRDTALIKSQALRNDYAAREAFYDREMQRLEAKRRKELSAIAAEIDQNDRVLSGADAALEALQGSNVVHMKAAAE